MKHVIYCMKIERRAAGRQNIYTKRAHLGSNTPVELCGENLHKTCLKCRPSKLRALRRLEHLVDAVSDVRSHQEQRVGRRGGSAMSVSVCSCADLMHVCVSDRRKKKWSTQPSHSLAYLAFSKVRSIECAPMSKTRMLTSSSHIPTHPTFPPPLPPHNPTNIYTRIYARSKKKIGTKHNPAIVQPTWHSTRSGPLNVHPYQRRGC